MSIGNRMTTLMIRILLPSIETTEGMRSSPSLNINLNIP
jgi:hypothetical protein